MDKHGLFRISSLLFLPLRLPSLVVGSSLCDIDIYTALRARWATADELCQQKLPFDMWVVMKAEGTAADANAQHVLAECINSPAMSLLTLKVVEGWEYVPSSDDCGHVIDSIPTSAAFACKNVADLEVICADEGVSRVSTAFRSVHGDNKLRGGGSGPTKIPPSRRLQSTVSEAGRAHEVAELVAGLEARGCENTLGDGQTLCVMSDSFNFGGGAEGLQASGDLPPVVENIKDISPGDNIYGADEGSAMMELAYDIAPNANYKFNTAAISADIFAADIGVLAATEGCDVIVDDIGWITSPAFRDGVISLAVDDAVDTHNILYFTAAGNDGLGHDFTSNMECTDLSITRIALSQCTSSEDGFQFYTNVFDDTKRGSFRYLQEITPWAAQSIVILSWDEDDGAARDIYLSVWGYDGTALEFLFFADSFDDGVATEALGFDPFAVGDVYYLAVHQVEDIAVVPDVAMQLVGAGTNIGGAESSSIYGQACATKATTVGAINWEQASGTGGVFADPETSPVEEFSSRGGCSVRTNGVLEERRKPVTTAADSLSTSTVGFEDFEGTSAAAPVAAAIATLLRAACAPERVVGHDDMMAILTNYDYILDYTSDAGGVEAFGPEAGYGIMSASKMLAWVDANCATACPGGTGRGTDAPTATPSPIRGTDDISPMPTDHPTTLSTDSPVSTGTGGGTDAPTAAPSPIRGGDDISPMRTAPPITLSTGSPISTGTGGGTDAPTATPSPIRGGDDISPMPTAPSTTLPTGSPVSTDDGDLVEAATKTVVTVTSTGFDERPGAKAGDIGCGANGCMPELTRDGIVDMDESRWSCKENIVEPGKDNCEMKCVFEEAQDIKQLQVAFYRGETRSRKLKLRVNGEVVDTLESSDIAGFSTYDIEKDGVKKIHLESVGLHKDEWISLLEVRFLVAP